MRVRVDAISFETPPDLEDRTVYDFRSEDPLDEFKLRFEFPAGGATPAEAAMAQVHERLDGLPVPGFGVGRPGDRDFAGLTGKELRHHFSDKGDTVHAYTLILNLGSETHGDDFVKFGWSMAAPEAELDARVDAVLASFAKAEEPPPAPPAPAWVRRQAGRWAFDLPEGLGFPRTYSWRDLDAKIGISITVHELGGEEPELDEPLRDAEDRGFELLEREDEELDEGALLRAHLRDEEFDEEHFVCRACKRYEFGDPAETCHVQIDAQGPWAEEARLRTLVAELLDSLRPEQPA